MPAPFSLTVALLTQLAVPGAASPDGLRPVESAAERTAAIAIFDDELGELGVKAHVGGCSVLMAARPGKRETIYGGLCRLVSGRPVMMCADTGVGEFALTVSAAEPALPEFVRVGCPGG